MEPYHELEPKIGCLVYDQYPSDESEQLGFISKVVPAGELSIVLLYEVEWISGAKNTNQLYTKYQVINKMYSFQLWRRFNAE